MPHETHGTRAWYQRTGCRCTPCRAANAAYEASYRTLKRQGKQPLGALIPADRVKKLVHGMLIEHFTFAEIARRIGLKCSQLRFYSDHVTVRTYLRIRRVYRQTMPAPPDTSPHARF